MLCRGRRGRNARVLVAGIKAVSHKKSIFEPAHTATLLEKDGHGSDSEGDGRYSSGRHLIDGASDDTVELGD